MFAKRSTSVEHPVCKMMRSLTRPDYAGLVSYQEAERFGKGDGNATIVHAEFAIATVGIHLDFSVVTTNSQPTVHALFWQRN